MFINNFFLIKNRVQRNKFFLTLANFFNKKAFNFAQTYQYCALFDAFFEVLVGYLE